ncbi:MAG: hypothetical protein K0S36_105 [Nitrosospira multiformis]|nr:hypothetical protein [Nitrosospira multiformis]
MSSGSRQESLTGHCLMISGPHGCAGHSYCYFALNIIGNRYLNMPPIIQMMSNKLEMTATPSISADKRVAVKLSNSCCPASLRRLLRRFLTHICSPITTGIRARDTSRLYSELSINNQPSANNRYRIHCQSLFFLFLLLHSLYCTAHFPE